MSNSRGRFRLGLAAFAAALLIATPSLCVAGLLEHACDCEENGHACDCRQDDRNECDDGCSHDGCANDPCQNRPVVLTGLCSAADEDLSPRATGVFVGLAVLCAPGHAFSPARPTPSSTSGPPGSGKRLPCHPSDIPLLL